VSGLTEQVFAANIEKGETPFEEPGVYTYFNEEGQGVDE